jgi:hypothetical protein
MTSTSSFNNTESRILLLSLRNTQSFLYNSCLYEFEDIIAEVDLVDTVSPSQYTLQGNLVKKILRHQNKFNKLVDFNPYPDSLYLEQEYDLLVFTMDFPWSILTLNYLKNWRKKCKIAVCNLIELWDCDIEKYKHFLESLDIFDFIFLGHAHVVERVSEITNTPCKYLPPGVNTLKFCPPEINRARTVDLCSLGRRSPVTHQALLELAETQNFYYYYDSANQAESTSKLYQEHRTFTANLLKNSRYFITNYAKVNLPEQTKGQMEIGYRFFEGAAAGTVMIGCAPDTDVYRQYFDWEDAVIPMNFNEPNIAQLINDLDSQPQRLTKIRYQNIVNSLLKHDWVYRWQEILSTVGLESTLQMNERQKHLQEFALSLVAE